MAKSILITGGGRGIGAATARLAGVRGWSVGINYRSDAASAQATAEAVEAAGGSAALLPGDVSREEDVLAVFDGMAGAFGRLDGLVNNAGIVAPALPLAEMSAERLRRVFDLNVFGAFLCAREAVRRLPEGGTIVNVSSASSRLGAPFEYVDYAASKGALDSLTIGLSKELAGRGIRVNAVRPGIIDTEIHALSGRPDRVRDLGPKLPMGRAGTAEETAEAIIWLISDAASYVSGALLDVTGAR